MSIIGIKWTGLVHWNAVRKWGEKKKGKNQSEGGKASCLVTEAKGPRGGRRWSKEWKWGGGAVLSCFSSVKSYWSRRCSRACLPSFFWLSEDQHLHAVFRHFGPLIVVLRVCRTPQRLSSCGSWLRFGSVILFSLNPLKFCFDRCFNKSSSSIFSRRLKI